MALLLPLDRRGGFTADIKDHTIDAADFIDDSIGYFAEQFMGQVCPVGGHEVLGLNCTLGNDVFIGTSIAHDPNRLDRQKYGECLASEVVP